jgi:hypothetical protein
MKTLGLPMLPALLLASSICGQPLEPANPALFRHHLELRRPDGHVDTETTVRRLGELGVNTYYWLIYHAATDWDDLKAFLPQAASSNISVWVYLVPPSESAPKQGNVYCEPYRLDYVKWAEAIGQLSREHTNLTAWVIDDFYANHDRFTPAYVRDMQLRARSANPHSAFLPLMYFDEINARFVEDYRPVIDGVVVAYLQDHGEIQRTWAFLNDADIPPACEFVCPPDTETKAGDYVMATEDVRILEGNHNRILFRERDNYNGKTAGYHIKQLLIDGVVVWEQDVAGGGVNWHDVDVDVTPNVQGHPRVKAAFRLLEKKGVSHFPIRWEVTDLSTHSLRFGANFEQPQRWSATHQGPLETGFGGVLKRGARRFHVPLVSMTAGQAEEFRFRHGDPATPVRIAAQLRSSLLAWRQHRCDGVVTYCLDLRPESATFPLAQKVFHLFGQTN